MIQPVTTAQIDQSAQHGVDAYDQYETFTSRNFCRLSYRIKRDLHFGIRSRVHSANDFSVGRFTTIAGTGDLIRDRAAISNDKRSPYVLYLPLKGGQELQQFSRTEKCGPGSIALISTAEPFIQRKLGDNDTVYFFMPRDLVEQRLLRSESYCARPISAKSGIARLVFESVISFQRDAGNMTDMEFCSTTRILAELALLAFDSSTDLVTEIRSVRASNLTRAKRIIRARFADPEFKISDIASECGISLRYLHELFQADGITVSEYLKEQRLQRARQMLENATISTTVTDVCMSCGFSNTSQFSTAFRRAFSVSPRDVLRGSDYSVG